MRFATGYLLGDPRNRSFFAIEAIEALFQQNTQLPEEVSFKADAGIMRARRVMNQIIRSDEKFFRTGDSQTVTSRRCSIPSRSVSPARRRKTSVSARRW